ncbi:MAG TPA: hypothetical protein VK436_15530 [Methanocella sp.]|nr:hypothetical protein [Methanocella sp.]
MAKIGWKITLGTGLVLVSLIVFGLHLVLFEDAHWLEKYLIFDLGLLPLEVIVVTLILDRLIEAREQQERLEKMNMVIGIFYSEIGVELLRKISVKDPRIADLRSQMNLTGDTSETDFIRFRENLKGHQFKSDVSPSDLQEIKAMISAHRGLLVQLLENPILLEHEDFTRLLRAVFHLAEELDYRKTLDGSPESDHAHLAGDVGRAYELLSREWLSYAKYLKAGYPYLYSLAVRTNPFSVTASPIIKN